MDKILQNKNPVFTQKNWLNIKTGVLKSNASIMILY